MSVCLSVTFLFTINNSRTLPGLPSSNFVHTSVLGSRGSVKPCWKHWLFTSNYGCLHTGVPYNTACGWNRPNVKAQCSLFTYTNISCWFRHEQNVNIKVEYYIGWHVNSQFRWSTKSIKIITHHFFEFYSISKMFIFL